MALIPFAVLWLAYQFGWYGVTNIMGFCGIGFTDLMFPGKEQHVDQILAQGKGANCDGGSGGGSSGSGGSGPFNSILAGQQLPAANNLPPGVSITGPTTTL